MAGTLNDPENHRVPTGRRDRDRVAAARGGSAWRQRVAAARGGSAWRQRVAAARGGSAWRQRVTCPAHCAAQAEARASSRYLTAGRQNIGAPGTRRLDDVGTTGAGRLETLAMRPQPSDHGRMRGQA
jgi:hypothetical protein